MSPTEDESAEAAVRVAEVLRRVEAGVRQRQAEVATRPEGLEGIPPTLARLYSLQHIEEPPRTSHRPVLGPIVFALKRVVYHLALKWSLRPMILQQNAFNQAVTVALQDLFDRQRLLAGRPAGAGSEGEGRAAAEADD